MSIPRCVTPDEYAAERRISIKTVYRLIKARKVPAERVGSQWRIWLGTKPNSGQHRTT